MHTVEDITRLLKFESNVFPNSILIKHNKRLMLLEDQIAEVKHHLQILSIMQLLILKT